MWKTRQENGGTTVKLAKTRLKSFVIKSEGEVKGMEMRQDRRQTEDMSVPNGRQSHEIAENIQNWKNSIDYRRTIGW